MLVQGDILIKEALEKARRNRMRYLKYLDLNRRAFPIGRPKTELERQLTHLRLYGKPAPLQRGYRFRKQRGLL